MQADDSTIRNASYSFRASFWGSTLFLVLSILLMLWSVSVVVLTDAPEVLDAIAWILGVGCVITGIVMIYRLLWRPVMVRVDPHGIFLKTHNEIIPWVAIEGARLSKIGKEGDSKQVVELVAVEPLHPVFQRGAVATGRSLNQMAGLPDTVILMDGVEGSNAMLLAAISLHSNILSPV